MNHTIDVQDTVQAAHHPSPSQFRDWVQAALEGVQEHCELSLRIVDAAEGARLNDRWRGAHRPTNVLSFPADQVLPGGTRLLGDIVICSPVVAAEARDQAKKPQSHWAHMVIHGTLHLLGYDHEDEPSADIMEKLEIDILAKLDIPNPYLVDI